MPIRASNCPLRCLGHGQWTGEVQASQLARSAQCRVFGIRKPAEVMSPPPGPRAGGNGLSGPHPCGHLPCGGRAAVTQTGTQHVADLWLKDRAGLQLSAASRAATVWARNPGKGGR